MSTENKQTHTFQAEVKQLLDIVIHSLYTDKEIFIRELISNAADSLEKLRYHQVKGDSIYDDELPLEINISTDDTAGVITIQDYGIGLTETELNENLGTIAHSGSKAFAEAIKTAKEEGGDPNTLIGQFGVGFYSSFMVAKDVRVFTRSFKEDGDNLLWTSDGLGSYEIEQTEDTQRRGAKIVLRLKDEDKEFANKSKIEAIIKKYSSFVPFPINLNGEKVNTVDALWLRNKSEIKPEEYTEFYKFQANAFDEPLFTHHFSLDAPLAINALLFTPKENMERFGFGRMEPSVSLYCKKVLIDSKPEGLLPEWLRFQKGVVDSADISLNISRESMQDSALVKKIGQVITGRIIKSYADEAKKNPEEFKKFYDTFGIFIKEGITTDFANKDRLAKLLRYESSLTEKGERISLEDYVGRMKDDQKEIYYLFASKRDQIEKGPYLESFKAQNLEVLFLYEPIDEFVMNHLNEFNEKKLTAADSADVKLDDIDQGEGEAINEEDGKKLCSWVQEKLGTSVSEVVLSDRLINSPAAAINADKMMTPSMRRIMKSMNQEAGENPAVKLELNPRHPLTHKLAGLFEQDETTAQLIAEQILDNSLVAAGFIEDPRDMVQRIYKILEKVGS